MAQQITLDTVIGLSGPDTLNVGVPIEFRLRVTNNSGDTYYGATNGFRLYSTNGATWHPHVYYDTTIIQYPSVDTVVDTTYYGRWSDNIYIDSIWDGGHFVNFYSDYDTDPETPDEFGQGSDTIGFGGYQQSKWGLYNTFDEIMFTIKLDSIKAVAGGKTICLDSAFYRPTGTWRWSDPDTIPTWDGPYCFKIKRELIHMGFGEEGEGEGGGEEMLRPGELEFALQAAMGRDYLSEYPTSDFRVLDPDEELQFHSAFEDEYLNVHVRYQQVYQGIKVYGNHIIVHLKHNNELRGVSGCYAPDISISTIPSLSQAAAADIAILDVLSKSESADVSIFDDELVFFCMNGRQHLSWLVKTATDDGSEWMTLVDASSGGILKSSDVTARSICDSACAPATGYGIRTYRDSLRVAWGRLSGSVSPWGWELLDKTRRASSVSCCTEAVDSAAMADSASIRALLLLEGGAFRPVQSDSVVDDTVLFDSSFYTRIAIDAYFWTGQTYDWLIAEHYYNSWDGQGNSMIIWAVDNPVSKCGPCRWSGQNRDVSCRLPCLSDFLPHPTAGEIIAHEWCHGVCDATSNVIPGEGFNKENDGIAEGFPMIMGESFKYWYDPDDTTLWRIGANNRTESSQYSCYINILNPHDPLAVEQVAAYYGDSGICGDALFDTLVSSNYQIGGVLCKWFQLLATGEEPPCSDSVNFDPIGVTAASKLAFRANRGYWHGSVNFNYKEAAKQTCMAARDANVDSNNYAFASTVTRAWQQVGVLLDQDIDADRDGYWNSWDNCPNVYNPEQEDDDHDSRGDSCDACLGDPMDTCTSCCIGIRGNVDFDSMNYLNISDLTYLVSYMFRSGVTPPCLVEANVNGIGPIDIADLTYLVGYMFKSGPAPASCP